MTFFKKYLLVILLFLSGCSPVRTPAGPTCVSCKPYFCRGSWNYPQTFYEYDVTGLASWYGDDFHGKKKATGESFDKMAITAAHRTLPIPSVVRVTNLRNGKSIIVVVDDRGPFCYKGRIIDLSYMAARELDLHRYKPSPVRVQTLVSDSLKLSNYISHYCKKRRDPFGRTWSQLYFQEIRGIRPQFYKSIQTKGDKTKAETGKKQNRQKAKKKGYNSLGSYLNRS